MATRAARPRPASLAGKADEEGSKEERRQRDATRMMVGVRVRPLSASERAKGSFGCLTVAEGNQVFAKDPDDKMGGRDYLRLQHNKDQAYQFDHAFGPESSSAEVYDALVRRIVHAVIAGYHGACFAYGATGSGKTFTMLGQADAPGVMPTAVSELIRLAKEDDECEYHFAITYVEIYNEKVKDLLNPNAAADLEVREDARQGTHIQGAVDLAVTSELEIMEHMQRGSMYRTTEATNCNEVSSRSHAVLQLTVKAVHRFGEGGGKKKRLSKLSMIDLAGSERAYKTDNRGQRLVEGRNINRSLLSLANCINALADRTRKSAHVPYRDSKLTRLLRDSLSGTSVAAMICNVSPSSDQYEETLNTLKYANRAKQMTPPQMPQKQEHSYNAVQEQVKVLTELQGTLVQMAKAMGKGAPTERGAAAPVPAAARAPAPGRRSASICAAYGVPTKPSAAARAQGSAACAESAGSSGDAGGVAEAEEVEASMAGVRRALDELVSRQPEARANAEVHAAYVSLDNMEGEELQAISEESAVLWREQQAILTELSTAQQHLKVARVSLAWREAACADLAKTETDPQIAELRSAIEKESVDVARLREDLHKTRESIAQLQADIPKRVVSSQRLSMLRLAIKQQEAATEALRYKMQARNKVAIMQEVMRVWHAAIPPQLRALLLSLFDLQLLPGDSVHPTACHLGSPSTGAAAPIDSARNGWGTTGSATSVGASSGAIVRGSAGGITVSIPTGMADEGEEGEEEEVEEEEALSGGAYVLNANGTASPWRTLGALAIKAALGKVGGGDRAAVWEEARRGLQGARLSRPAVLALVEEAANPADEQLGASGGLPLGLVQAGADGPSARAASHIAPVRVHPTAEAIADPLMMSYHPDQPQWMRKPDFVTTESPSKPVPPVALPSDPKPPPQAPSSPSMSPAACACNSHGPPDSPPRKPTSPQRKPKSPQRKQASSPTRKKLTPLPPHWHEATDPEGKVYYYNDKTNATTWSRPGSSSARPLGSASAVASNGRPSSARGGRSAVGSHSGFVEGGRPSSAGPRGAARGAFKPAGAKKDAPFR